MSYKHETKLRVQSELARRGWSKAAQVIIEFFDALENSDEYKATQARIADLEARLATAEVKYAALITACEELFEARHGSDRESAARKALRELLK